jgi:hypothetical protein
VTEEIARRWHNDVPWWYNERANLSVFAGGVWRSGGHAFEEFSDKKRKMGMTTGRLHGSYAGRVDMYFETRYGEEYYLEGKACESGAARAGHDPRPRIKSLLDWACDDVRKFHPHGCRRLGVVFVKPYIRRQLVVDLNKQISDWLWWFEEDFNCDAWHGLFLCHLSMEKMPDGGVLVLLLSSKKSKGSSKQSTNQNPNGIPSFSPGLRIYPGSPAFV